MEVLLGGHHGGFVGICRFHHTRHGHEEATKRGLSNRVDYSDPSGTDVGQRVRLYGHGKDDLLLRSRPADLGCESNQDRQDICLA